MKTDPGEVINYFKRGFTMDFLWQLFENYDEMVSVVDIDEQKIVFLNRKYRERVGISCEECAGRPCYDIICKETAPCKSCRAENLTPYVYDISFDYDKNEMACHVSRKTMMIKDGKRYRFEIGLGSDSSPEALAIQNLEAVVNKILKDALKEATPDATLNMMIRRLGILFKADRAYIFEKNPDGTDTNTYEWVAQGITPEKDHLQSVPSAASKGWYDAFANGKTITIEDIEDVREVDPALYETLAPQNIRSLVVVPLYSNEKIIGFFGVDNPESTRLDFALDLIEIMCHFIVASIERRKYIYELKTISYTDQLTGFGNRHAMMAYVENEIKKENTGILYCDVTGLKRINDTEGHAAGDDYIRRCCKSLRDRFEGARFFRIGGDELLVVKEDIDESVFNEMVASLQESYIGKRDVLAVGAVFKKGDFDFEGALMEAEKMMYRDKAAYYRRAGIDRRK